MQAAPQWDNSGMVQVSQSTDFTEQRFGDYYRQVRSQLWRDLKPHIVAHILAVTGGAVTVFALAYLGINPDRQNLPRIEAAMAWSVCVLPLYLLGYAIRSPWKIHNNMRRENDAQMRSIERSHQQALDSAADAHSETRSQLQTTENSLGAHIEHLRQELQSERDQNAEPNILIRIKGGQFKVTVEHTGHAHDGGEPVYFKTVCVSMLVSLTNTRPRQVTLDSYQLIVELPDGDVLRAEGCFAGDPLDSRAIGYQDKGFPSAKRLERDLPLSNGLSETRVATFFVDVQVGKDDNFHDTSAFVVLLKDSIGTTHMCRRDPASWNSYSASPGLFLGA